jgi:predicted nucleotidyltransferase component of viral defense system
MQMKKLITNKAGSIKAKLLNLARAQHIDFDALFLRYLQERFLYRLSNSPFASHFILKGGLLLIYLNVPQTRATKDIDFLGVGVKNTPTEMKRIFARIAGVEYADGVRFDVHSITLEEIKPESEYVGLRLKIDAYLGKARKRMQLDIGFGDVVWPKSNQMKFPTIAGGEPPKIKVYSIESIISEKFEAMVKLSLANSRMKDFYDVYILSANHSFDGGNLGQAVKKTFERRATPLDNKSLIFRPQFRNDKERQKQWLAFLRKSEI